VVERLPALLAPDRNRTPAARPASRVAELQRQVGNRGLARLLARQTKAPAQGPATAGVSAPMSLQDFKAAIARYGVSRVVVDDWDPGDPAAIYRSIADAFADFAAALGGAPPVDEIRLRKTDPADPNTPAAFSARKLEVFDLIERRNRWLPVTRSSKGAKYSTPTAQVSGVKGQQGGAPLALPTRAASERRVIAHELGHAIVEGMLTPGVKQSAPLDKDLINRFKKAVGWFGDKLYDIQDPAVRKAIQDEGAQPSATPITSDDWNNPKWGEQPITEYPLTGAHEDFPESLMAYLYAPELLKLRSPARFRFFESEKAAWKPILIKP
jgi:hypothetical protein